MDERGALAQIRERLDAGDDPAVLVEECRTGMERVGRLYEQGTYFISALIMAGEIIREATELLIPRLAAARQDGGGKMVIATVRGDIHDIGKNIVIALLDADGFTMVDLGVNVAPEQIAEAVERERPDVLGLSCLLTSGYEALRETIELVRERTGGWHPHLPIVIGGTAIDQRTAELRGRGRLERPGDILAAPVGAVSPSRRRPRLLDPLPISILLALVFTAAGLVELLTRGAVPVGYRDDGPALIALDRGQRALAGAPLVVAARRVFASRWPPVRAGDRWLRVHAGRRVGRGRRLVRDRRLRPLEARLAAGFIVAAGMVVVFLTRAGLTWQSALSTWASLSVVWVVAIVIRVYRGSIERAERTGGALRRRPRGARARGRRRGARPPRARAARQRRARAQRRRPPRRRRAARHRQEARAGARGAGVASRRRAARRSATSSACSASCALRRRRPGCDAAPGLAQLEALCAQVREAGLPVDLIVEGEAAALPRAST